MKTIENKNQLRREIVKLKGEVSTKEIHLKESIKEFREEFRPETFLINAFSNLTGLNLAKGDFLKSGLMATISIVLHRFLHNQESVLEKKIFSWAESFLNKLRNVMNKVE